MKIAKLVTGIQCILFGLVAIDCHAESDFRSPILKPLVLVDTRTSVSNPSYEFTSSEAGTMIYHGDCVSSKRIAVVGRNKIVFEPLLDGKYNNCYIRVKDAAGNVSTVLRINTFAIDTRPPVLTQISPVFTPSENTRPEYSFRSSEAGHIIFTGVCAAQDRDALAGYNNVKFKSLIIGKYNNCSIQVKDLFGHVSLPLEIPTFEITVPDVEVFWSKFSVLQGESITLYASTKKDYFNLNIYLKGFPDDELKFSVNAVPSGLQPRPLGKIKSAELWNASYKLHVGKNWPSGIYKADVNGDISYFSVVQSLPGSVSKIVVLDNAPTNVAYNNWGGKSLYTDNSFNGFSATTVSLKRPNQNKIDPEQLSFVQWAYKHGVNLEFASMFDLQTNPQLLSNYKVVVVAGHSEYWSKEMRDHFDGFIKKGGNAMILSGNTMLWQIRNDAKNMICYKSPTQDPMLLINPSKVTNTWARLPVNRPQNLSIGTGWIYGGYVNINGYYIAQDGSKNGGYIVNDSSHWIFNGTRLENGDSFGVSTTIVGREVDGVDFSLIDGKRVITGKDGTPLNFKILAFAKAHSEKKGKNGHATMGISTPFFGGGQVFNAATIDWADGLFFRESNSKVSVGYEDPIVSKITMNVLNKFKTE